MLLNKTVQNPERRLPLRRGVSLWAALRRTQMERGTMKITASDLLAILRQFKVANDDNVPRHISQIVSSHPGPINQLVSFRFDRSHFFALIDQTAEDRKNYIMQQIYSAKSDADGELLKNPTSELMTYGLPFKGKDVYLFQIVNRKRRLDVVLSEQHPETSRSTWQKYIKSGNISVNGAVVTSPKNEISDTDSITINLPETADYSDRTLPIIYLDDDVIVINKPAGVLTHSKGALNDEFTVADFFRRYTTVGLDTNRPGIVHRLDRDTSGVLIGARTPEAFDKLKKQFSDRKARKLYLAITAKPPKQPTAKIDIPLGRNPSAPSTWHADVKGKSAQTIYQTLATTSTESLLALRPLTGRTHQLRVHLSHIGAPIIGDRVYGKPSDRLYLHAYQLEITTAPERRQTFTAPIPDEFRTYFPEVNHAVADL